MVLQRSLSKSKGMQLTAYQSDVPNKRELRDKELQAVQFSWTLWGWRPLPLPPWTPQHRVDQTLSLLSETLHSREFVHKQQGLGWLCWFLRVWWTQATSFRDYCLSKFTTQWFLSTKKASNMTLVILLDIFSLVWLRGSSTLEAQRVASKT